MQDAVTLTGFNYQPRVMGNHATHGRVKGYRFYVSQDSKDWGAPVAAGEFPHVTGLQTVTFAKTQPVRFFKFETRSDWSKRSMTVVPEFDVITAP